MEQSEAYKEAVAAAGAIERELGVMSKGDPRREAKKAELATLLARVREAKEAIKREKARRNFTGIGSPLHEAMVACLEPSLVLELEADAFERLAARERMAAQRRAAKDNLVQARPTTMPPEPPPLPAVTPKPRPLGPEIIRLVARRRPTHAGPRPAAAPRPGPSGLRAEVNEAFVEARRARS
jgi:hypothetical protein